jgi:DNA protecting protein DprA
MTSDRMAERPRMTAIVDKAPPDRAHHAGVSANIELVIDTSPGPTCTAQNRWDRDDFTRLARVEPVWNEDERAALVALLRTRPSRLTWPEITDEVSARGSARAFWHESHPAGLFEDDDSGALDDAARDIAAWRSTNLGFLTFRDGDYPAQLREIHEMPPVLFHLGKLLPGEAGVSVVGSRQASARGLAIAHAVATGLADRDITVIAGLAKGIDTAAHQAAIDAGGRTVAVIGTGINQSYPAENRELQARIAREGLVLSQFWPDAPPTKHSFPMRNAVMSGFGRATIVVEAGEHSGARIQARKAVGHGRPVIFTDLVVETNKWPSDLIGQPGVHVARSTAEIMSLVEDILTGPNAVEELLAAVTER